jgi:hypothetical protein
MLQRERVWGEIADPCWKGLVSSGGLPCWVCTAIGQFALDPPPALTDCRGGLFCDEPVSCSNVAATHRLGSCRCGRTQAIYLLKVEGKLADGSSVTVPYRNCLLNRAGQRTAQCGASASSYWVAVHTCVQRAF